MNESFKVIGAPVSSGKSVRLFDASCESVARTKMRQHRQLCIDQQPLMIEMPPKGAITEFKSWHKTTKCPFVIYADLEAFNVKTDDCGDVLSKYQHGALNSGAAATHVIEQQYPCSFGAVLVDVRDGKVAKETFYRRKLHQTVLGHNEALVEVDSGRATTASKARDERYGKTVND